MTSRGRILGLGTAAVLVALGGYAAVRTNRSDWAAPLRPYIVKDFRLYVAGAPGADTLTMRSMQLKGIDVPGVAKLLDAELRRKGFSRSKLDDVQASYYNSGHPELGRVNVVQGKVYEKPDVVIFTTHSATRLELFLVRLERLGKDPVVEARTINHMGALFGE